MRSLQEKFQISPPPNENEAENEWLPWSKTSADAPVLGTARESQKNVGTWIASDSADMDLRRFNEMPPGMDITQCRSEQNDMPFVMAGESSVSKDTNPESFREGFKKLDMKGTDDQYTGEHMDLFYGDADGFVERNNYLDRM